MCRKVHFKAGVIFHHPVCVASDASLTQNTSLDHFREKYFLLFKCAFEKLNQNSPFGISFGICPHPSQLLPALKHFCQKITLCFQPEFKFLGKHYLSSTILNKFKKRDLRVERYYLVIMADPLTLKYSPPPLQVPSTVCFVAEISTWKCNMCPKKLFYEMKYMTGQVIKWFYSSLQLITHWLTVINRT